MPMLLNRRNILKGLTSASTLSSALSPNAVHARRRRVTQAELDRAIFRHERWFEDSSTGERAVFSHCDLSCLNFSRDYDALVNLAGADFTEADLSGTSGGLISFIRTSLHGARLSWSSYQEPSFSGASLRSAQCDNAVWGSLRSTSYPPADEPTERKASFFQTYATNSNFENARLDGLFVGTSFVCANLIGTDFTGSWFINEPTTFWSADLTRARFTQARISTARFNRANCRNTDFSGAEIHPRVAFSIPEETSFQEKEMP